jgi:2-oxoglutarate dehydrogenase E2 component (dihydrolipoamide succinyltransferase)
MGFIEIAIPSMGEGITEVVVRKFLKKPGEPVNEDETIAEVSTDKVDTEIVSPSDGSIAELLVAEGDTALVGQVIIRLEITVQKTENKEIDLKKNEQIYSKTEKTATPPSKEKEIVAESADLVHENNILHQSRTPSGKFLSPLIRNIAKIEGISMEELDLMQGTGTGNRLTRDDLASFIFTRKPTSLASHGELPKTQAEESNGIQYIEMDRIRKLIAEHMIESKKTSAHVTTFIEIDVSNLVTWREKVKETFIEKYNEKITYTPIFIEAIVQAIKEFPMINVSVEKSTILLKKNINIGMATALPDGNLIVPVIKGAAELNLLGITKRVNDLAVRARTNKLKPDEIQGGTFTVTNLGQFDSLTGTPIINQPQVAIIALGTIKKRPVVIETPGGDTIGIRQMMIMSMSYDHRVVDGALGGSFLKKVALLLESFDSNRKI